MPARGSRVFVQPDIHRHAADAALKMRLALRRGHVAFCDSAAQAVFSRDDLQGHIITSAQITHRFAQHRQHVRTDIQNHAVRVAKRTRVRLAGGKVKRDGFSCGVNSARLLQKAVDFNDVRDAANQRPLYRFDARHPVIERQHAGSSVGVCQQRVELFDLGKRGDDRFFNHNPRNGRGYGLFQHLEVVQRCGGNKESIKRYGEKFRKRSAARDAFRLPGGENIKSKTMNRVTIKAT